MWNINAGNRREELLILSNGIDSAEEKWKLKFIFSLLQKCNFKETLSISDFLGKVAGRNKCFKFCNRCREYDQYLA
jgi:hypothetical protein